MSFLRRRLFVAYALLIVFLGACPGVWIGQLFFHPRRAGNAIDVTDLSQTSITICLAHAMLIAFLIYLHTRPTDDTILQETPRSLLMFSYASYAIGLIIGIVLAGTIR